MNITQTIAAELNATAAQVEAAVALLDEGATVPFIARYRKEATGGLDDSQLRTLAERLQYLRELLERRIHQSNMKTFLEEHPDKLPMGLNVDRAFSIRVTRPRGA